MCKTNVICFYLSVLLGDENDGNLFFSSSSGSPISREGTQTVQTYAQCDVTLLLQMRCLVQSLALVTLFSAQPTVHQVVRESQRHEQYVAPPEGFIESKRHEQFLPPPAGFSSPIASSPAFQDLGGFMADHRRDRMIFGFKEHVLVPDVNRRKEVEREEVATFIGEVLPEPRTGRRHDTVGGEIDWMGLALCSV